MRKKRLNLSIFLLLFVILFLCATSYASTITGYASGTIGTFTLNSSSPALQKGSAIFQYSSWASAWASDLGGQDGGFIDNGLTYATVSTAYGIAEIDPVQESYSLSSYEYTSNNATSSIYAEAGMDIPPQRDATSGASAHTGNSVVDLRVTQPTTLTLSIPYVLSVGESPTSEGEEVYDYFLNHLVKSYVTLSLHAFNESTSYNYWTTVIMTADQNGVVAQYSGNGWWPGLTGYNIIDIIEDGDPLSGILTLTAPFTLTSGEILFSGYTGVEVRYVATPEPSTMLLLGFGLVGLVGWRRNKFKKR